MNYDVLTTHFTTAKLEAVKGLLEKLTVDLDKNDLTTTREFGLLYPRRLQSILNFITERDAALEELKVYGRDPRNADPIFTKEVS